MKRSGKSEYLSVIFLAFVFVILAYKQADCRGLPTPEQIAWHEMEIEMFLCLDPCTWQGREYDDHSTSLDDINPVNLNTDQWCEVAQSFGAKQILFVAKHTGGFCWWQTDTSEYSIKNTPYKDGTGDVLGELAASCKKYSLKLGVYVYPGDDQWGAGIGSGGRTKDPAKQEAYNQILRQQWTEVLTRYGEISEIWFDGSCVIEVGDIIKKYAPKTMVFQGPYATLRWPGNEQGIAPYPAWQTVKKEDAISGVSTSQHSDPDGDVWLPMEMDTTLLDHKWFWAPDTDHMMKPLEKLMSIYYASVGRGCVLLLDATPNTDGLIPESHIQRYKEFGEAIHHIYKNKKGETSGKGNTLELHFDHPCKVNHIITMEDIRYGHIIRAYQIEAMRGDKWEKIVEGSSVGYKKIDMLQDTIQVQALRLHVTESADTPIIKSFAAYDAPIVSETKVQDEKSGHVWQKAAGWEDLALTKQWETIDIDLTLYIRTPGQYEVEFKTDENTANLEISNAVVVMAGTEAPRLIRALDRPHAWNINRTAQVTEDSKGATILRIVARLKENQIWKGQVLIRSVKSSD